MEDKPSKPGRFGDIPKTPATPGTGKPGEPRRGGAPIPLVTQAFGQAAHPDEIAMATRVHMPPMVSSTSLPVAALQAAAPAQFSRAMSVESSSSAKATLAMSLDDIQRKTPVPTSPNPMRELAM